MPHSLADGRKRPRFDLAARRRRSLLTNLLVLAAGAAALLCFIAVLADARRAGNAMRQSAIQVESFIRRMGGTGVLPLNLDPHVADDGDPRSSGSGLHRESLHAAHIGALNRDQAWTG